MISHGWPSLYIFEAIQVNASLLWNIYFTLRDDDVIWLRPFVSELNITKFSRDEIVAISKVKIYS